MARIDGRRAKGEKGESREKKLRRIKDKRRQKEGLLWWLSRKITSWGVAQKL